MAEKLQFSDPTAAWSKIRRNGNDEVPTDKNAVKIIRTVRTEEAENTTNRSHNAKPVQTKVAKLVYAPKNTPIQAVVKSIHTYRSLKQTPEAVVDTTGKRPFSNKNKNEKFDTKKKLTEIREFKNSNIEIKKTEVVQKEFILKKQERENDVKEIKQMLKEINKINGNDDTNAVILEESKIGCESKLLPEKEDITPIQFAEKPEVAKNPELKKIAPEASISQRSKTDPNLLVLKLQNSKNPSSTRKRSLSTARSKSSSNLNADIMSVETKRKSYNSEEARKFMEEQKKKRIVLGKSKKAEERATKIDRDEIKKRLDNLRKNTLKILNKNIKKAKKSEISPYLSPEKEEKKEKIKKQKITISGENPDAANLKISKSEKSTSKISNPIPPNNKKIGLLRKTDEVLISPIPEVNLDLENVIDDIASKLPDNSSARHLIISEGDMIKPEETGDRKKYDSHNIIVPKEDFKNVEQGIQSSKISKSVAEDIIDELQLSIPEVKLKRKVSIREKSIQVDTTRPEKSQIPYWLKPTPVQIYPYNFIMAVRKKLEAIANPVLSTKKNEAFYESNNFKSQEAPALHTNDENRSLKRRLSHEQGFQIKDTNMNSDLQEVKGSEQVSSTSSGGYMHVSSFIPLKKEDEKSLSKTSVPGQKLSKNSQKSSSAIESNFSSISLHLPESNSISEISSIPSEDNRHIPVRRRPSTKLNRKQMLSNQEDDTTISSSIFSSPEKQGSKQRNNENIENLSNVEIQGVSPLSIENISKLQINSKRLQSNITVSRDINLDSSSNELNLNSSISRKVTQKVDTVVEFEQLLEDFNKSLSQVIEVNQQIKSAFNNSPKISNHSKYNSHPNSCAQTKNIPSTMSIQSKPEEYSSDFEEPISTSGARIAGSDIIPTDIKSQILSTNSRQQQIEDKITSISKTFDEVPVKRDTSTSISTLLEAGGSEGRISSQIASDFTTRHQENSLSEEVYQLHPISEYANSSIDPSQDSVTSEEFIDSIEEISKMKQLNSPQDKSVSSTEKLLTNDKQFPGISHSKNSFSSTKEEYSQVNYFQSHINVSRGDFLFYKNLNEETSEKGPPAYTKSDSPKNGVSSSLGSSEIFAVFNQSDIELSVISQAGSLSEAALNYSSIGLYEQLLQAETIKSDHLSVLLKMREKALMDRTRGQIAWLEVQKEKYKAKGLTVQISAIKKKQRAILLKMEKEREEIKRLLQIQTNDQERNTKKLIRPPLSNISDISIRRNFSSTANTSRSSVVIKGQELQPNHNLELMLQKREQELKIRRTYVERLIEWHQRLDKEEEEVLQLEKALLEYNSAEMQVKLSKELKSQKRIEEIDKSIKVLQNITSRSDDTDKSNYVRASGHKLNKLWRRLTGQKLQKFEPTAKCKLSKKDLEDLYEEAKLTVLRDFGQEDEMKELLDLSKLDLTSNSNKSFQNEGSNDENVIPRLNLDFSSGRSDAEKSSSSINSRKTKNLDGCNNTIHKTTSSGSMNNSNDNKISLANIENDNAIEASLSASSPLGEINKFIDCSASTQGCEENVKSGKETISVLYSLEGGNPENGSVLNSKQQNYTYSQPSDNVITKLSNNTHFNSKNSDTEKMDTVAEITSLSYDSNNSLEDTSKQPLKNGEIVGLQEEINSDKNYFASDKHSLEDQPRSSVIVSHISSFPKGNTESIQVEEHSPQTIIQSAIQDTATSQYTESFLTYRSDNTAIASDQDLITPDNIVNSSYFPPPHSDTATNNSVVQTAQNIQSMGAVVDSNSVISCENIANENLEYSFGIESTVYEATFIEDISVPKFESTIEDSKSLTTEDIPSACSQHLGLFEVLDESDRGDNTTELEKRLIDLDESLKELNQTFERALSPEKSPTSSRLQNNAEDEKENIPVNHINSYVVPSRNQDFKNLGTTNENSTVLMPDIVNEVEIRRRKQLLLDSDLAVSYVFLREIPNKPPPPYVPPAHGSPMTTIFPSEQRIEEITFRRVKELYDELTTSENTSSDVQKFPSIMDENITNIYERIILDICREMMLDIQPTLKPSNPETYKNPLALYNPPNRLKCMQDRIYKHIRKLLAMDKRNLKRNYITGIGRRKRDPVYEILIQELYEEEHKWTNFDMEESEVKKTVVDDIFNDLFNNVLEEIIDAHKKKILKVVTSNVL